MTCCTASGMVRRMLALGMIAFFFCTPLRAEDQTPIVVNGDSVEFMQDEKKIVGVGNILIEYQGTTLTCDRVTVFIETKDALAEGNVHISRSDGSLSGETVRYNFTTKKGEVLNASVFSAPWFGGAQQVDLSEGKHTLQRGYVTTSDFDKPEYRVQARRVLIYPDRKVVGRHVLFFVGKFPVLYLPAYVQPLDNHMGVRVTPGHSKDWGYFALTSVRYELNDNAKGKVHLDYRELKDFAWGVDYQYKTDWVGSGLVRTYYMNERNLKVKHLWSDRTQPTVEHERYRAQIRHKWTIDPSTMIVAEYNRIRDRAFLKDYFEAEYEKEPQQNTYAVLTNTGTYHAFELRADKRVNHFYTTVQRLPEAKLQIMSVQLANVPLYYSSQSSIGNLDEEFADRAADDIEATRLDTYNQLAYPTKHWGFLSVNPYFGTRETFYSEGTNSEPSSRIRHIWYSGIDFSTNFYRTFQVATNLWGLDINNLRHVVAPQISYAYIREPSNTNVPQFDSAIDGITERNAITFTLDNFLQTKRFYDGDMTAVDLVRWTTWTTLNWRYRRGSDHSTLHQFSNIESKLELRPRTNFYTQLKGAYDPYRGQIQTFNTDFVYQQPTWQASIGHRYEIKANSQFEGQYFWQINRKWSWRMRGRYEFQNEEWYDREITLSRDLHSWILDIIYENATQQAFWIVFRLKAFPELFVPMQRSWGEPRDKASRATW